jgi:hypothetical protein
LKETRKAAIVADWGTGKDGFIASVIVAEDSDENPSSFDDRIFQLHCDTFESIQDLEQGFTTQLGVSISDFPSCFNQSIQSCLLLDGLQPSLINGEHANKLVKLVDLLLDYTPSLSIIIIGRSAPENGFNHIEIKSLDLPDFRLYIEKHQDFPGGPINQSFLETIFDVSGGLPIPADRILTKMRLASFEAVIAEESELSQNHPTEVSLHRALQQAIESVRKQDNQNNSRAIKLLKTLSMLTYGETIEQLKHFDTREPLFTRDVKTLDEANLIDIIPLQTTSPIISTQPKSIDSWGTGLKLLRIPKQVRDCVITALIPEEKKQILSIAGEFYFGKDWRIGKKIKLRKIPLEYREYITHGPGNE